MPFCSSNFQTKILIQAQVHMQHEAPGRIGLNHVRVSPIVSAEGEAARRSVRRPGGADLAGIVLMSVASPSRPSARIGSTATEPPK